MIRLLLIVCLSMLFYCSSFNTAGTTDETIAGVAIIYSPDGTLAVNATVQLYNVGDTTHTPVCQTLTDDNGRFELESVSNGTYNFWVKKDTLVACQDSIVVAGTHTTITSDTLERCGAVLGHIRLQVMDDPRRVVVHVPGTSFYANIDTASSFSISGLASGSYMLELVPTNLADYTTTFAKITAHGGRTDTLDTIEVIYNGIPLVPTLNVLQDTLAGVAKISWNKTTFRYFQDYVLFRDSCSEVNPSTTPYAATADTFYNDTIFKSLKVSAGDTENICLKYRVAIRNNVQKTGSTYRYVQIALAPKSYVTTFFTNEARQAGLNCDSASIHDTVIFSVTAWNMTRLQTKLAWYDPAKKDTIGIKINTDSSSTLFSDTMRYAFDSAGVNYLMVFVTDNSGKIWPDTIPVNIVRDVPVVNAGNDTGVFVNDTVRLHGSAMQQFGSIVKWAWKIGSANWVTASGPDTMIIAPSTEQTVVCSLAVTDDDGNISFDVVNIGIYYKVKSMAAGNFHSLILKADSTMWACGYNNGGQLGDGTTTNRTIPVPIITNVQSMAAGLYHSMILKTDGSLLTCGENYNGQLCYATNTERYTPMIVMTDVQSVAAGFYHSLFLKKDSTLWGCGSEKICQRYDTCFVNRLIPLKIMTDVKGIAAGAYHNLILRADDTLWACGDNSFGQIGDGTDTIRLSPVKIMGDVTSVAASGNHSMILKTDGTLWACGDNSYGQIGDGTTTDRLAPVQVMANVKDMAAGENHSLILKADNTLWVVGCNNNGQLGDGTTVYKSTPVQIMKDVRSMIAGSFYSMILKTDGSLWACGYNAFGQLGDGTTTDRLTPERIVPKSIQKLEDGK